MLMTCIIPFIIGLATGGFSVFVIISTSRGMNDETREADG
jgi:hypothetical protein